MQIYYYYKYKCKDGKKKRGLEGLKCLKSLEGLKGLKCLKSLEGLKGLKCLKGIAALSSLRSVEGFRVELCDLGFGTWNLEFGSLNLSIIY